MGIFKAGLWLLAMTPEQLNLAYGIPPSNSGTLGKERQVTASNFIRKYHITLAALLASGSVYTYHNPDKLKAYAVDKAQSTWSSISNKLMESTADMPRLGDERLTASAEAESLISAECVQTYRIFNKNLPSINISVEHAQEISQCADSFVSLTQDVPRCQFLSDEFSNWAITFDENPTELKQDRAGNNVKTYPISEDENKLMQLCAVFQPITSKPTATESHLEPEVANTANQQEVVSNTDNAPSGAAAVESLLASVDTQNQAPAPSQTAQQSVNPLQDRAILCEGTKSLFTDYNSETDKGIDVTYSGLNTISFCAKVELAMSATHESRANSCLKVATAFDQAYTRTPSFNGAQEFEIPEAIASLMNRCVASAPKENPQKLQQTLDNLF